MTLNMYFKLIILVLLVSKECTSQIPPATNGVEIAGNFYKCKCKQNEALIDGSCQSAEDPLMIGWDVWSERVILINVTQFNVSVRQPICPEGKSKAEIDLSRVLIYPNGSLYNQIWYEPLTDNYCVEFLPGQNDTIGIAQLCQLERTIPLCCGVNHTADEDGSCRSATYQFEPPYYEDVDWTEYSNYLRNIQCSEGFILRKELLAYSHDYSAILEGYPLGALLRWHNIYMTEPIYLTSEEYCVSVSMFNDSSVSYSVQFCMPDVDIAYKNECLDAICVRKCCPNGYIYDSNQNSCMQSNYTVAFAIKDEPTVQNGVTIWYDIPCEGYIEDIETENNTVLLSRNGFPVGIDGTIHAETKTCIDGFSENAQDPQSPIVIRALVCFRDIVPKCHLRWTIGSIILGISCIFYLLTIIVYVCIEDLRKTIGGKCLISEVSALLVAYLVLIYLQSYQTHERIGCYIPGTIEHIAVLAAFFWLNILCYDMWSTLKTVRSVDARLASSKKFIKYCIYGWGTPFLITGIRLGIDYLPEEFDHPMLIRSELGEASCFFSNHNQVAKWVYLYIPVLLLFAINIIFFIHVAVIILRADRDRKRYTQSQSRSSTGKKVLTEKKDKMKLHLKLFIVMGMTWLFEVATWIVVPADNCYLWLLDLVNMLQGVLIFMIFVCKKSVMEKVRDSFRARRNYSPSKHSRTTEETEISSRTYEKSKRNEDSSENVALKTIT